MNNVSVDKAKEEEIENKIIDLIVISSSLFLYKLLINK